MDPAPFSKLPFGSLEDFSARQRWAIVPRKRLEIEPADMLRGLRLCATAPESDRGEVTRRVEQLWSGADAMVLLSVRTGFDLLLRCLRYPPGTEIIMSGVTIKDMVYIALHHGLRPIAIDLDRDTCAPRLDHLAAAITPNTRMIIVAHIFGSLNPMDEVIALGRRHGLFVIEDCAECFMGTTPAPHRSGRADSTPPLGVVEGYRGHDEVDASFFSFGVIKTATAMGAAIGRIRDPALRETMQRLYDTYPVRARTEYASRLAKSLAIAGISTPALYGVAVRLIEALGKNHDEVITNAIRGFPGPDLIRLIRRRPEVPLIHILLHRLSTFPRGYLLARVRASHQAVRCLGFEDVPFAGDADAAVVARLAARARKLHAHSLWVPAHRAAAHAFWLFPVMVRHPARVCEGMLRRGYDVSQGTTQLGPVDRYVPDSHRTVGSLFHRFWPWESSQLMRSIVYLPVTAETGPDIVLKMIEALLDVVERIAAEEGDDDVEDDADDVDESASASASASAASGSEATPTRPFWADREVAHDREKGEGVENPAAGGGVRSATAGAVIEPSFPAAKL